MRHGGSRNNSEQQFTYNEKHGESEYVYQLRV